MTRVPYPGGQYADANPFGAWAVLFPMSHLESSIGTIALPPGDEPLYHRIPPQGGFAIAGQAHVNDCTWFFDGAVWQRRGVACGVSPVIFDLASKLHISDCSIGSQGWRYVQRDGTPTGRLVTGDATYGPLHGLNEYTDLGDGLLLGQGNKAEGCPIDGGAVLWDGAMWRLLEDGPCRFIRADRVVAGAVSVALWKEHFGSVVFFLTVAELRARPVIGVTHAPDKAPGPIVNQPRKEPPVELVASKSKDEIRADIAELIRFYNEPDGLNRRARGIPSPVTIDDPAIFDWVALAVLEPIESVKARIRQFDEYQRQHVGDPQPPRPAVVIGRPVADGRIFRINGQPWRYCGVTAFKLLELFRRGQDVTPFLRRYGALGFNVVRVFRDKPAVAGLDEGWSAPSIEVVLAFFALLASEGFWGELTLCTQPTPDLSFIPGWMDALRAVENCLVEGVNEPQAHDKPDTAHLRALLAGHGALPYASGDYDPPQPAYGSYFVVHADRVPDPFEMARKAKVVSDVFNGWDADPANPASVAYRGCHCPVVGDEPGKPQDFGYNLNAILAHFAIYGMLGAGGTFHTLGGQFGALPDERELACATVAANGLHAFPPATATGQYVHDTGDESATGALRTYRVGAFGVRVRPTNGAPILIGV